jgi:hypothetical protein
MAKQETLPQIIKVDLGAIKTKAELQKIVTAELEVVQTILKVETAEEREQAHNIISNVKKVVKYVGEERMKLTRILDAKKAEFMQTEKEIVADINKAVERASTLVKQYDLKIFEEQQAEIARQREQEFQAEIARQEQARLQAQQEELDVWDKEVILAPIQTIEVPKPATIISAPKGLRMVRDFRVIDFLKVPDKYKVLDNTLVREAMRADQPIDGIEYFSKPQTAF